MLTGSMALAGVLVMAAPANAAIDRPVAIWQMNEAAGSRTMVDSSGKISLFRGSAGSSTTSAGSTVRVNDGNWHTVRCERTPSMVTMIIDGVVTGRNRNATGNISNTRRLTIAGKGHCDQLEITCDYFSGDLD
jgi:Laminin G domain